MNNSYNYFKQVPLPGQDSNHYGTVNQQTLNQGSSSFRGEKSSLIIPVAGSGMGS